MIPLPWDHDESRLDAGLLHVEADMNSMLGGSADWVASLSNSAPASFTYLARMGLVPIDVQAVPFSYITRFSPSMTSSVRAIAARSRTLEMLGAVSAPVTRCTG